MAKQFAPVSCTYGAPMGRSTFGTPTDCAPRTVRVFKVRLSDGYDDGGAYWGCNSGGAYLYCATDGADYRAFSRAPSRADAIVRLGIPCTVLARGDATVRRLRERVKASEQHYIAQALRAGIPLPGMTVAR